MSAARAKAVGVLEDKLQRESGVRGKADTALDLKMSAARAKAVADLDLKMSAARAKAVGVLDGTIKTVSEDLRKKIMGETQKREKAVGGLEGKIKEETAIRKNALQYERGERGAADTRLANKIKKLFLMVQYSGRDQVMFAMKVLYNTLGLTDAQFDSVLAAYRDAKKKDGKGAHAAGWVSHIGEKTQKKFAVIVTGVDCSSQTAGSCTGGCEGTGAYGACEPTKKLFRRPEAPPPENPPKPPENPPKPHDPAMPPDETPMLPPGFPGK